MSNESPSVVITPGALLHAIAVHEELTATCAALPGLTRERAQRLLHGIAVALQRVEAAPSAPPAPRPNPMPRTAADALSAKHRATDVLSANDLSAKHSGQHTRVRVFSDGASRGNPGPAGAGAVLLDAQGKVLKRLGKYIGRETNNVAEYAGVILGLRGALEIGAREVDVRADSELMIKQLKGDYRVKNEGLKPLFSEAQALLRKFEKVTLRHVPREENTLADEMSNRAIDEKM